VVESETLLKVGGDSKSMVGDDDDVYFKKLFVPDPGLDPG
jgi:hypothetical protein